MIYWSSTKAPVHLFKREYESAELAAHIREYAFVDPAMLAAELRTAHLCAQSVAAYQRRLGIRKIASWKDRT